MFKSLKKFIFKKIISKIMKPPVKLVKGKVYSFKARGKFNLYWNTACELEGTPVIQLIFQEEWKSQKVYIFRSKIYNCKVILKRSEYQALKADNVLEFRRTV